MLALLLVAATALAQAPSDVDALKAKAAAGDPEAQNSLGVRYRLGDGVERDKEEAVRWFRQAARQGYATAMFNLGAMYYNGDGVPTDDVLGYTWFLAANDKGTDTPAADAVSRGASELGHQTQAQAMMNVAHFYELGEVGPKDEAAAARWYERAIALDSNEARVRLGVMYMVGRGVPKDPGHAVQLYQDAVKEKYAPAMFYLGFAYETGDGEPLDYKRAAQWYEEAARLGSLAAYRNLGEMYSMPQNPDRDLVQSYMWFFLCSTTNDVECVRGKDTVIAKLSADQVKQGEKKAREWWRSKHPVALVVTMTNLQK